MVSDSSYGIPGGRDVTKTVTPGLLTCCDKSAGGGYFFEFPRGRFVELSGTAPRELRRVMSIGSPLGLIPLATVLRT